MYKIIVFLAILFIAGCGAKSPTQDIINAGVEQIERAEQIIKNTETLEQCKTKANDSLLSAKTDLVNAGKMCKSEISKLESDLLRWKEYFWLLIFGIGATIYVVIIKKLGKGII